MALNVAIIKETGTEESRVAASPETVKKLVGLGASVVIEAGAGRGSAYPDTAYEQSGATVATARDNALTGADVILKVQVKAEDLASLQSGTTLIGLVNPYQNEALIKQAADKKVNLMAMELVPRISRAQSMDVLSSQANLAGYRAVLEAAHAYTRAFPMMMTAAGTVPPAKVFIMGAGVAGLQAIATAKRLGAVVSATDVRPAAKEQVASLGGSFVAVEDEEFKAAETAGGYAKEMSKEYQRKQAELVEGHIAKQDIVITTALIPGRPAPRLISKQMIESMKPGSVVLDMAVESGGNCELSKPGENIIHNGVTIIGIRNLPSHIATDASALYAKNLLNLLGLLVKDGNLVIDTEDEIVKGILLTHNGQIVHPNFARKE